MKHIVESKDDLQPLIKELGGTIIDDKKIQKDGRLYFGKDKADQIPTLAILDWDQNPESGDKTEPTGESL